MEPTPTSQSLIASVIVPTHNRAAWLPRTLEALTLQTVSRQDFEVVLVADGCTDHSRLVAQEFTSRLNLKLVEQPAQGAAAARNRGASEAQAPLLIFMDDDISAWPGFIEAHLNAHLRSDVLKDLSHTPPDHTLVRNLVDDRVVIGYLRPVLDSQKGFFRVELFGWWEDMFQPLRLPGRRFRYSDLTSGNFSLRSDLFFKAGSFDAKLKCREDYELGVRLQNVQAEFVYSGEAGGDHYERSDFNKVLHRKLQEGKADVIIGQTYPELRSTFLMYRMHRYARLPNRFLRWFAFHWPAGGDLLVRFMQLLLALLDRVRLLRPWQRLLDGLLAYWYWRGVAQELKTLEELEVYFQDQPTSQDITPSLEIDLRAGIEAAERLLDEVRPKEVFLFYGNDFIGHIPPEPGGERLCGRHLRPLLAAEFQFEMLTTLVASDDFEFPYLRELLLARWGVV